MFGKVCCTYLSILHINKTFTRTYNADIHTRTHRQLFFRSSFLHGRLIRMANT